jgi:beta-lactamase superfamily II metal-dependent hydrolase
MSITDYETWWLKSGNFNMNLFINYLRAKNEKLQSDIQGQRWQMDGLQDGENHRSSQPRIDAIRRMDMWPPLILKVEQI